MGTPREELDELIGQFISGKLSFDEFMKKWWIQYADREADRNFSDADIDFYAAINERAEWTTQRPTLDERVVGWQDIGDFTLWLQQVLTGRQTRPMQSSD